MMRGGDRRSQKADIRHGGNPIWEYRTRIGISQSELAERMYLSQSAISDMERGRCRVSRYALEWIEDHQGGGIDEARFSPTV